MGSYHNIGWNDVIRSDRFVSIEEGLKAVTVNVPQAEMKPFSCPHCGGNSYKVVNEKTVCEYCNTAFVR